MTEREDSAINRRQFLTGAAALLPPATVLDASAKIPQGLVPMPIPEQKPVKEGLAKLSDVSLWYWDTGGKGPPIVLLHPFTGSALVWSYQQPVFAKAGYRVIGYSRRAYQKSEVGPKERPGTGSGDLHELLNFFGIDTFHAVASAGGCFVATDYALSHPERLQTLTLACSRLGAQEEPELAKLQDSLQVPGLEKLPAYFRELSPSYRAANPEGAERWKELEHISMPGERIQQAYANKATFKALSRWKMPTLLLCGEADLIAPPPVARLLAKYIPNSEVMMLPECGHSAYWEQPALFNQAVLGFIGRHHRG